MKHITPSLRPLAVPVTELRFDPANARQHNEKNHEAIKSSLARFGQRKPIVVRKSGMIVEAGNGTLAAARDLGWEHVAAIIIDDDATTAAAYALADNRSAELADWNHDVLAAVLQGIEADGADIGDLGWDSTELDALLHPLPVLPDEEVPDEPAQSQDVLIEIYCTHDALEELQGTLDDWARLDGVTVNISQ